MFIQATAFLALVSLGSTAAIEQRASTKLATNYGIDPTKPFNLYAYQGNNPELGFQLNLGYLDNKAKTIGLVGYNPYGNETMPPATQFTASIHFDLMSLQGEFDGKTVSTGIIGAGEPITFHSGANGERSFVLTGVYNTNRDPNYVDNVFTVDAPPDQDGKYGFTSVTLCDSTVLDGFKVLSYFAPTAPNKLIKKPCPSGTLHAWPLGFRPPISTGP